MHKKTTKQRPKPDEDADSLSAQLENQNLADNATNSTDINKELEQGAVGGMNDDDVVVQRGHDADDDHLSSVTCTPVNSLSVNSKPSKKRSKFWNFLKRNRRSAALAKCVESGEEENSTGFVETGGCHSSVIPWRVGRRCGSPDPESPTPGNVRRLSMGAGSRPIGMMHGAQLMAVVPPAPLTHTLTDINNRALVMFGRNSHDFDDSSNPVGYPHLHFSQSFSSSSSSSSSSSGILMPLPLMQAPSTPECLTVSISQQTVHTQVDYMHCLVPDLLQLTNCCFYWGVMDRYEAERLLEGRPEGTFLVRDSAQEEFLFSVSFRRYGRSLHARIEQWNHRFSFDSHDPDVFAATSVCALVEHYKDPAACMFFEPMLTLPLRRVYAFTLQHLCRAAICSRLNYDDISTLHLPRQLQEYLKYYHYKQRICVRRFEAH